MCVYPDMQSEPKVVQSVWKIVCFLEEHRICTCFYVYGNTDILGCRLCCVHNLEILAWCASRVGTYEVQTWDFHKQNGCLLLNIASCQSGTQSARGNIGPRFLSRAIQINQQYAILLKIFMKQVEWTRSDPVGHHFSFMKHWMIFACI